jgi:hypothetical protein
MTGLPPGFVLDQPKPEVPSTSRVWGDKEAEAAGLYAPTPQPQQQQMGGLPQGFVLDAPAAPQIDARFGEFAEPSNASALQSGLRDRGMSLTRGPAVDPGVTASVDFQNQGIAAAQRTTPNIRAQSANLISDQVFENDAGLAVFRDPATGNLIEAQDNKHVILRDPADNRLKVFGRTENTDEGALSAGGRLMGTGFAAGAVTRRPAVPTTNVKNVEVKASDVFSTSKPYYREFEREAKQVGVPAETATGIAERIRGALDKKDLIPDLAPTVYKAIDLLDNAQGKLNAGEKLTLDNLQRVKRVIGKSFNSSEKNVRDAAAIASAEINKVIAEVSPSAAKSLKTADDIQSTAYALQDLQRKGDVAGLRTARAGYRANATNNLKQVISPIIQKSIEGKKTPFKPNEIEALRDVGGTGLVDVLHTVGQFDPRRGALATAAGAAGGGAILGGPVGAVAIPAIGAASNKLASVLAFDQFEKVKDLVAKRSPAYAEAVKKATERYERAQLELVNKPGSNSLAAFVAASRDLSNGLSRDGISVSSADLIRAIQGPMKGPASDEQPEPVGVIDQ